MNILYKFSIGIWDMFLEMSPYLLLGFAFAGILHVLVPKEVITKQIGKKSIWSILKATLLGVPLPLCSCGVIPTGVSFYKNGASKGATNAFLISTPQTGVDSILITSSLMNWPWAIMRPIIALITGVFGGLLTDKMDTSNSDIDVESCSDCTVKPKRHWLIEIIDYAFFEFLPDISRQLIIGILIAVAITLFIPTICFFRLLDKPILKHVVYFSCFYTFICLCYRFCTNCFFTFTIRRFSWSCISILNGWACYKCSYYFSFMEVFR